MITINQVIQNELVVVDLTLNTGTTPHQYDINEHRFGSLATNYRMVAPARAAYFEYTEPTHSVEAASSQSYLWAYLNPGSTTTTVSAYLLAPTTATHKIQYNEEVSGVWSSILAHNKNCLWIKGATDYKVLRNTGMTSASSTQIDPIVKSRANL